MGVLLELGGKQEGKLRGHQCSHHHSIRERDQEKQAFKGFQAHHVILSIERQKAKYRHYPLHLSLALPLTHFTVRDSH